LDRINIPYRDLCETPPEFNEKFLNDPLNYRKYQHFLQLKSIYTKPIAAVILYMLEKKLGVKVLEMYCHDLIGGSPSELQGYAGRDIDFIIVVDKELDLESVKRVERYLDDLLGLAISDYYYRKGESFKLEPFNKVIKHNLVELHVVTPDKKGKFIVANSGNIKKADIPELRKIINEIEENIIKEGLVFPKKKID
jgi:hypothetical protein